MKETEIAGLTVRLAGGDDREGGGQGPMVVLLHGFGAPGTDLVPLWRQLDVPAGTRFAFPEAPHTIDVGMPGFEGRAWWMLDVAKLQAALLEGAIDELANRVPEGLDEARERIVELLDELEERYAVRGDRLVLGGFSQGAMLSLDVALRSEHPFAGLVLMSGTLISADEWRKLLPTRRGLPVLQSHGRDDPLLSFTLAERLRDLMQEAGLEVTWVPFNGGHGIADSGLDALSAFIRRTLAGPK
jgi:phospholipase/carboxylesterase